jgi:hypothetical protein
MPHFKMNRSPSRIRFEGEISSVELARLQLRPEDQVLLNKASVGGVTQAEDSLRILAVIFQRYREQKN